LELIIRAYRFWESHRWPGRNGRLAYARSIYSVFILRTLEDLSLRIWDDGDDRAGDRLREIQRLLDRLNETARPNGFVRDARWLVQTAQGPLTRRLAPYFKIADRISASLTDRECIGSTRRTIVCRRGIPNAGISTRRLSALWQRPSPGTLRHVRLAARTLQRRDRVSQEPDPDRQERREISCKWETSGKWFGVSKIVLTACTSQGQDALITDVPPLVVDVLRLTCPNLVVIP
jgi:hypothetical protein